jgi:prepilin-type N-terminal cleavage/methylation domain-containing protein
MRMSTATHRASDAGFTLVELLVAIVLVGIVSVAFAGVVIGYSKNADTTSTRLALSHDAQESAAFFAGDVASVGTRDSAANGQPLISSIQVDLVNGVAYDAGDRVCGSSTIKAKVRFLADDWGYHYETDPVTGTQKVVPDFTVDVVSYYLVGNELHRMKCLGSTLVGWASKTDVVVAHHVDPATLTVGCPTSTTNCADAPAVPQRVKLDFTVVGQNADPYQISLTGQRRQT